VHAFRGVTHRGRHRVVIGDVDREREGVDLLRDRLGPIAVEVEDGNLRAFGSHPPARLGADARTASGHHRALSGEECHPANGNRRAILVPSRGRVAQSGRAPA
jgi:hypothetical protein